MQAGVCVCVFWGGSIVCEFLVCHFCDSLCAVEAHMLIWTNYVVAERGSVTDAECDKYCHCGNCQTNITRKHMRIMPYAFAQLHKHADKH